jgi:DNA-directed RNA polymerase specialized sigma24 family protein
VRLPVPGRGGAELARARRQEAVDERTAHPEAVGARREQLGEHACVPALREPEATRGGGRGEALGERGDAEERIGVDRRLAREIPDGDAVIIPDGQLADVLPDGLVEALEEEGPSVALDPRWTAARDAFLASISAEWGWLILQALGKEIARRRDGAQESAKDLRQKVLLVVCRRFEEHVARTGEAWAPDNAGPYLRGVSRNVARDHFKAKARRPAITRGVEVDETAGTGLDPEEAACHVQLLATFERERGTLPAAEAEVFEGRVSLGMTFPAIAAVLGRPVSTVHVQYRRAVEKLNTILERVW